MNEKNKTAPPIMEGGNMPGSPIPCDVEFKQMEDDVYSLKINGHEISQFVTGFSVSLDVSVCAAFPIVTIKLMTNTINLSTKAAHVIPDGYKWAVESEARRMLERIKEAPCGQDAQ